MGRVHARFSFRIRYRKGALNSVADTLSRISVINALSFIEFNKDLFDLIPHKQKYLDDNTFSKFWKRLKHVLTLIMEPHLPRRTFTML